MFHLCFREYLLFYTFRLSFLSCSSQCSAKRQSIFWPTLSGHSCVITSLLDDDNDVDAIAYSCCWREEEWEEGIVRSCFWLKSLKRTEADRKSPSISSLASLTKADKRNFNNTWWIFFFHQMSANTSLISSFVLTWLSRSFLQLKRKYGSWLLKKVWKRSRWIWVWKDTNRENRPPSQEEHKQPLIKFYVDDSSLCIEDAVTMLTSKFASLEIKKSRVHEFMRDECKLYMKRATCWS